MYNGFLDWVWNPILLGPLVMDVLDRRLVRTFTALMMENGIRDMDGLLCGMLCKHFPYKPYGVFLVSADKVVCKTDE